MNVSVPSVKRAASVQKNAAPAIVKMVQRGEIPVSVAAEITKSSRRTG